jgi:hypothetical protein
MRSALATPRAAPDAALSTTLPAHIPGAAMVRPNLKAASGATAANGAKSTLYHGGGFFWQMSDKLLQILKSVLNSKSHTIPQRI